MFHFIVILILIYTSQCNFSIVKAIKFGLHVEILGLLPKTGKILEKMYGNIPWNDVKVVPFNENVCYNESGSVICKI